VGARSRLRASLDTADYQVHAAFEPEWYLIRETDDGFEPFDQSGCYTADGIQSAHDIVLEIVDGLAAQGMEMATYYPEYSPGQQEIAIKHSEGLIPADNQTFYKQTVKAVARNHGLRATFSPKPFPEHAGSGSHLHLSLWTDGENAFYDPTNESRYPVSETCKQFIGGSSRPCESARCTDRAVRRLVQTAAAGCVGSCIYGTEPRTNRLPRSPRRTTSETRRKYPPTRCKERATTTPPKIVISR
jgi:glutamine synthetase